MESFWFAGCPDYKPDLVKLLKRWYPRTPISRFRKKKYKQLRMIYANTRKTDREKAQARAQAKETGRQIFWPTLLKEVLKRRDLI